MDAGHYGDAPSVRLGLTSFLHPFLIIKMKTAQMMMILKSGRAIARMLSPDAIPSSAVATA